MTILKSFNPFDGQIVGEVEISSKSNITKTVEKARFAQPKWMALDIRKRADYIIKASEEIKNRVDQLAHLITDEMGKPLTMSGFEVKECCANVEAKLSGMTKALNDETIEDDLTKTTVKYSPLGVSAIIAPWNFPLAMIDAMAVPALLAGNTIVVKPSEETPLIGKAWAEIYSKVFPDGVVNLVNGGKDVGSALVNSDVDMVCFTGSTRAGKSIMKEASDKLKRIVLELGGKDPLVVLEDGDLQKATDFAVRYLYNNSGQMCVSTERIYVHDKIVKKFTELLIAKTKNYYTGNPKGEPKAGKTLLGPLVATWQKDNVVSHIEDAVSKGAKIVYGSFDSAGSNDMADHKDNFVEPTIMTDVNHNMKIMIDETFGPVACVMAFSEVAEMIKLCNDTRFGLGGMIFGEDEDNAFKVANQIETAMIGVNRNCSGAKGSPWIGLKESGISYRGGALGIRNFTQLRHISVDK